MRVRNIHERLFDTDRDRLGALIDSLASADDRLWPTEQWPAMRFDRPLGVGATGGHGPIRYFVSDYQPAHRITFTFTGPPGFEGQHAFEIDTLGGQRHRLRHRLEMVAHGSARLSWPLLFRPLHDALIEDALDKAERHLGATPAPRGWSPRVRLLRHALRRLRRKKTAAER